MRYQVCYLIQGETQAGKVFATLKAAQKELRRIRKVYKLQSWIVSLGSDSDKG